MRLSEDKPETMALEKFVYDYSQKDIPNPTAKEYKLALIRRTEEFLLRLRWAFLEFLKPKAFAKTIKQTYQIKTQKLPKALSNPI